MTIGRSLCAWGVIGWAMAAQPGLAGDETEYDFAARMPPVHGRLVETIEQLDDRSGLAVKKSVFSSEFNGTVLRTHVVHMGCQRLSPDAAPLIIAYQYHVQNPKSRDAVMLSSVFPEVYVQDRDGRIRAYQELGGRAMAALTRRFQPACERL